ncbi:helix-turn-helix domain-containing protein [Streptomonospora nanhaiensis]|uniref:Transcriptional regulator with XRE-family HTH domain n=1 Tax=Streptomonospora nanhaiensis TaxID=1323731 RepID=A0A853BPI6_9ACTN|nr:helix-turn-helix transcriptional regulator [Streptomonospora nanhaiensis]MBX9388162.1 helix-turn-helix domain-containing protein [Streptomonospora nanhaiensis]NYI97358.1 transcriptional regulator with XRE-family HTH domain [Streptomonospora nanhaiensis]
MSMRFGIELRKWRQQARLSQQELADAVPMSQSHLSAIERGAKRTTEAQVLRLDSVLSAGGQLLRRWEDSQRTVTGYAEWFAGVAVTEREATEIREYCPLIVAGLLQTGDYARAVFREGWPNQTERETEDRVRARMERQALLENERPPMLRVVLEEHVLDRPIGGREAMKTQLRRLVEMAQRPHVVITVVPTSAPICPGQDGGFMLFTVPNKGTVAFTETKVSGHPSDDPETVAVYLNTFGDLTTAALPPAQSLELMKGKLDS